MRDGMRVDTEGRLYAATRLGIQVCDQPGRVRCAACRPQTDGCPTSCLVARDFDTLYAMCGGHQLDKRRLKVTGEALGQPPTEPPRRHL